MDRRVLARVVAPVAGVGAVLITACLLGTWAVDRLHFNLSNVLADNVAGSVAAQDVAISLRQLRFHSFVHAIDPSPARAALVDQDCREFEAAVARANATAGSDEERILLAEIEVGYARYRDDLGGPRPDPARADEVLRWADRHPVGPLVEKCQLLLAANREATERAARESEVVSQRTRWVMLLLGVVGPLVGVSAGFYLARGLSRSISRAEEMAAVGLFAAGVAHEIRNPLTAVKLLTGMALRGSRPGLTDDDLRVIHREVERVEIVVRGLLDFARPGAIDRRPCDLRDVVREAIELVRPRAESQRVVLDARHGTDVVSASADKDRLAGAVMNLLLNALDAMPSGGTLEVELTSAKGMAQVAIRDSGSGIDPSIANRLFTPFATTKATGTGLGLSVCRRTAEAHGGTVAGANLPGGGACFVLTIPTELGGVSGANPARDR